MGPAQAHAGRQSQREALLEGFDEALWRSAVEVVTVYAAGNIGVVFRDGREVRVGK